MSPIFTSDTQVALVATRAADTLVRLKYYSYESVRTEISVVNKRRKTIIFIKLKKGNNF